MWKVVETKTRKVRVAEIEEKRRKREKMKGRKEKPKEKKKNGSKKSSKRIEDLEWEGRSGKVRGRGKEVGPSRIL